MFGLDDKQDKRIANRIDWITQCAVIILAAVKEAIKNLPDPPQESSQGQK